MRQRSPHCRDPIGRQLHDERRFVLLEQITAHQPGRDDSHDDSQQIQSEHHPAGIGSEECADQQDIDGNAGAARHEGDEQYGDEPAAAAFDRARGHDGRYVAAETHDEWNERLAVQPYAVHDPVHDEGCASQVARILHESDEQV